MRKMKQAIEDKAYKARLKQLNKQEGFYQTILDGISCGHSGCKNHFTHPSEKCGRTAVMVVK